MVLHSLQRRDSGGICKKPPPGSVVGGPGNRPIHISQACRWSLMELAPFPCGRLPGFRRASPSTPLDAYCYVTRKYTQTFARRQRAARRGSVAARNERRQRGVHDCASWPPPRPTRSSASRRPSALGRTRSEPADADHRQPVRDDGLRPAEEPRRVRAARQLSRSTRSTPRRATTRPSCAARRRARATTSSSRSAATARSTRRPTGSSAPTRR